MKHLVKNITIGACTLSIVILSGSYIYSENTNNILKDPLQELLGDFSETQQLSADFLPGNVQKYTGPISSSLAQCIADAPESANEGFVYATIDQQELSKMIQEKSAGTFNRNEIKNSLANVLGFAMNNNQINWDWKGDNNDIYSYEFHVFKSQEPLWNCYFSTQSESEFFERFFSETHYKIVELDTDNDGIPNIIDTDDDNDGVNDSDEIKAGTNPLLQDSDGNSNNGDDGDLDTDGDGISNADESQDNLSTITDTNNNGIADLIDNPTVECKEATFNDANFNTSHFATYCTQ